MRKHTKKITAIASVASASVLMMIFGVQAVFTDNPNDGIQTYGREGTVDITVTDIDFDVPVNGKDVNINPGDCDPYSPAIADDTYRSGTTHEITYHVENLGTKSVRTRHVITLTMVDTNGNTVEPTPMMISELENGFYKELNNSRDSLCQKIYCLENGKRIEVTETEAFYVDDSGKRIKRIGECGLEPSKENIDKLKLDSRIISVEYIFISNVLDGTSKDEDTAEIEHDIQTTGADYTFYLGMYHMAETNAYKDTSIVAKDSKVYLLEGLKTDENQYPIGTEVTKILNGYYKEASEVAPNGKMYLAKDTVISGTNISGTEVVFVDMKYIHASLVAKDGNMYLVSGFSEDEDGNLSGTQVVKQGTKYFKKGTSKEVSIDDIMHWDASYEVVTNANPRYYYYTNSEKTKYEEIAYEDLVHWVKDSSGNATYTPIYKGAHKYVIKGTNTIVQENEIAHWDTSYNLIRPTEPIGGTEHEKLGNEGARVKVNIEIQAQQYRNTTNDDWEDWTVYSSSEKEYIITDHYAKDTVVIGE